MEKQQRFIVWVFSLIMIGVAIYPTWWWNAEPTYSGWIEGTSRHFILHGPPGKFTLYKFHYGIYWPQLVLEWLVALFACAGLLWVFRGESVQSVSEEPRVKLNPTQPIKSPSASMPAQAKQGKRDPIIRTQAEKEEDTGRVVMGLGMLVISFFAFQEGDARLPNLIRLIKAIFGLGCFCWGLWAIFSTFWRSLRGK